MIEPTTPVRIPTSVYLELKRRAEEGNRSLSREIAAFVTAALKAEEKK